MVANNKEHQGEAADEGERRAEQILLEQRQATRNWEESLGDEVGIRIGGSLGV